MIAMLLLVFMAGTSMFFVAMSDRSGDVKKLVDYNQEMVLAKEALITFAVNYPDLYTGPNNGPGRLPCPDDNLNGQPETSCNGGAELTYRLPVYANTPNSGPFYFSRQFIEASQETNPNIDYSQFWYALSNGFATDDGPLNSSVNAQLQLDNASDYVALIIAPGTPLTTQGRSTENARNNRNNYLEAPNNRTDTGVFSNYPEIQGTEFNDSVIGITRSELMTRVTMKVAIEIKQALDNHHESYDAHPLSYIYDYECLDSTHCYPREGSPPPTSCFWCPFFGLPPLPPPGDVPRYETVMADAVDNGNIAEWYEDDNWNGNNDDGGKIVTYQKINDNTATLEFDDCAIVYTLKYGTEPEIERSERSC
ncbi:MAG: hypothetical protein ACFHHU_02200 [Porticoccaceae bacterium]